MFDEDDLEGDDVLFVGNELVPHPSEHPIGGEKIVKQADARDADINVIMQKWTNQGVLPRPGSSVPTYGDFSSGDDYHALMNRVLDAEEQFNALPAKVRDYCNNDPGEFLDLVLDPEKREELVKLGLLPEAVPERVQKVEVISPQDKGTDGVT